YQILSAKTLLELTDRLPSERKDLEKIHGIGKVKVKHFGEIILSLINDYRLKNNLSTEKFIEPEKPLPETKRKSLMLFKDGLSVKEIAETRELSQSTIESHLADLIGRAELS